MVWTSCVCVKKCGQAADGSECNMEEEFCNEGCECADGYVQLNGKCVIPEEKCPCQYDGKIYPVSVPYSTV